jgi:selenocysteine-specific elongation factor
MGKHVTFGVAGHVDHGKTSLVRLLTGIDTDRLKEEKRRGLSIESGIAPMAYSPDLTISLVDVPGHTDFLKNTIRGLSCVDAAVLVIAADDGVMPQTIEHLEILKSFGTKKGFVVLSKADLVDDEILELAQLEVEELLKDTFLDKCRVIPFSAADHRGLEDVRAEIFKTASLVPGKDTEAPFRLWIDQVKAFPGLGTVVSGTVLSGRLSENEEIAVLPKGIQTRARSLQVHHAKVAEITAGQRAGVNLHKVSAEDVARGMVLSLPGAMEVGRLLNVRLQIPARVTKGLKDRQKVRVHLGTALVNAMLVIMDGEYITPGSGGLAQLRLSEDTAVCPGDPFLISPLNEQRIIAGGRVLEITKEKFRAVKASKTIPYLEAISKGDVVSFLDHLLGLERNALLLPRAIAATTGLPLAAIASEIKRRVESGELIDFAEEGCFPTSRFNALKDRLPGVLEEIMRENPLKQAASADEIKARLAPSLDEIPYRVMVSRLAEEERIIRHEGGYRLPGFSAELSPVRRMLVDMLLAYRKQSGLVPFSADTFWKFHRKQYNKNEIQRLLDYLHTQGKLIRLSNRRYMTPQAIDTIKEKIRVIATKRGFISIGDCKEIMGYGRTVGVPVLEYLDSIGFTTREGDKRTLS